MLDLGVVQGGLLTFGGTVIGSITGFYFGGQSKGNKQNA
jgi:uncharacterized membrane protein YdjX (TVP38/TMEM64 family)